MTVSTDAVQAGLDRGAAGLGIASSSYRPPALRPATVVRADLVKRLLDASPDHLVVVSGPPGYGKTTAVRLWEEADRRPFAWLNLDPLDNDPVHLVRHLALALHRVAPVDRHVARRLTGPGRDLRIHLLPALVESLEGRPPFVLAVDDVQTISSRMACECLKRVIGALPAGSQAAVLGRSTASLGLARLRMTRPVLELTAADLALSTAEARELFDHLGLTVDEETLDDLVHRTEGWAGGLYLAALALDRHDGAPLTVSFTGRNRLVADYLVQEVLERVPDDVAAFLQGSAVLDRMSAPLLDDLLDIDDAGRRLADMEHAGNLFLVPLDDERQWYRYHHLLTEMLRAHLRAFDPARADRLERRASVLLEQAGDVDGAIAHALGAGDQTRAADLVQRHAIELVFAGRVAKLGRWLAGLEDDTIESSPAAAIAHAWHAVAANDRVQFQRGLLAATRADWQGPLPDGSPSVEVAVALLRAVLGRQGVAGVLRDTAVVRAGGGTATNPWWGVATLLRGTARIMLGDLDEAEQLLLASLPTFVDAPAFEASNLAHLALLDLLRDDVAHAAPLTSRALALVRRHNLDGVVPVVPVIAVGALVEARRGRWTAAAELADVADRTLAQLDDVAPRTSLLCNLVLAQTALALGDPSAARARAGRAERARRRDDTATHLVQQLDELQERLATGRGGPANVSLTPAERRLLPHLSTHLSLQDIADELHISRNTAKSHSTAIYRKLGASSRHDAVTTARRLGLLGHA